jgi:hypothetical protein
MKKIILSVVAVMAFGFANAQDKGGAGLAKGNLVLTGAVGFSSVSNVDGAKDAKSSDVTFSPGVGYMMSDKLMIVGNLDITSGTKSSGVAGDEDAKVSGFGFKAGVRYFFTPAENFSLSLGGELGYGTTSTNVTLVENAAGVEEEVISPEDQKTTNTSFNVPVGMHYFVSNNFAIQAFWGGLGYSSSKPDVTGAEATSKINLDLNMSSISFGLLYKL